MDKIQRKPVDPLVRQWVMDRYKHKCAKCQSTENLTIDHIISLSEGGEHIKENMQVLCLVCNKRKGAKSDYPFFGRIRKIWNVHNYVATLRTYIKLDLIGFKNEMKNLITKTSSEFQSTLDKKVSKLTVLVEQQEKKIKMLEEYLKISYTPEITTPAKYKKVKKTDFSPL